MKSINTLIGDIYKYMDGNAKIAPEKVKEFGDSLAQVITDRLTNGNQAPELRMSNFGTKCERKLWYQINQPEDAEPLEPWARIKFLYGDILESLVLFLAKEAGHQVEGEQTTVELKGIKGHRDGIIDGVLVDVKSANSRSFDKFKYHQLETDDPFGYRDQLGMYLEASKSEEALKVKGEYVFLAVDKELGHLAIDKYKAEKRDWDQEIQAKKEMLKGPIPERGYSDVPDGASGNRKLPMPCNYCPFKHSCWSGLRSFKYSNGVRHLTRVERTPEVEELPSYSKEEVTK